MIKPTDDIRKATLALKTEDRQRSEQVNSRTDEKGMQFLKDKNGVIYGVAYNGKIYINKERMSPETPIHEYTHLWDLAVRKKNPKLWKRGVELMKQTDTWKEITNNPYYKDLSEDEIASEVHARLTGQEGERIFRAMQKSKAKKYNGMSLVQRMKAWLKDFWFEVKNAFSENEWNNEDLSSMSVEDFINMPVMDLVNGTKITMLDEIAQETEEEMESEREEEETETDEETDTSSEERTGIRRGIKRAANAVLRMLDRLKRKRRHNINEEEENDLEEDTGSEEGEENTRGFTIGTDRGNAEEEAGNEEGEGRTEEEAGEETDNAEGEENGEDTGSETDTETDNEAGNETDNETNNETNNGTNNETNNETDNNTRSDEKTKTVTEGQLREVTETMRSLLRLIDSLEQEGAFSRNEEENRNHSKAIMEWVVELAKRYSRGDATRGIVPEDAPVTADEIAEYLSDYINSLTSDTANLSIWNSFRLVHQWLERYWLQSDILRKIRKEEARKEHKIRYDMHPYDGTYTSPFISSMNIAYIRKNDPNGYLARYYDRHEIDKAIADGILDDDPEIFFITDKELEEETKRGFDKYDEAYNLPVVAVVKSKNGTITINGQRYQPVAVMAATKDRAEEDRNLSEDELAKKEWSAGAAHMRGIRELAKKNKDKGTGYKTALITDGRGRPLVSRVYGINKTAAEIDYDGSNDVIELGINGLTREEANNVNNAGKTERRKENAYKKMRDKFFSKLHVIRIEVGYKKVEQLAYRQREGSKDEEAINIYVFIKPVNETTGRDTDKTFSETVKENNPQSVIHFNSRTEKAAKALEYAVKVLSKGSIYGSEALETLHKYADRALTVTSSEDTADTGWRYHIVRTGEDKYEVRLYSHRTRGTIHLTTISGNMSSEELEAAQAEFIRNILLDENGDTRMNEKGFPLAKWGVAYNDVLVARGIRLRGNNNSKEKTAKAKKNLEDIYDDGIFSAAATTFDMVTLGIDVTNPIDREGPPATDDVANPDNATPPSSNPPGSVETDDAVIDANSGVIIEEKPKRKKKKQDPAKELENKIKEHDKRPLEKSVQNPKDGPSMVKDEKTGEEYLYFTEEAFDDRGYYTDEYLPTRAVTILFQGDETAYDDIVRFTSEKFADKVAAVRRKYFAEGWQIWKPKDNQGVILTAALPVRDNSGKNIMNANIAVNCPVVLYHPEKGIMILNVYANGTKLENISYNNLQNAVAKTVFGRSTTVRNIIIPMPRSKDEASMSNDVTEERTSYEQSDNAISQADMRVVNLANEETLDSVRQDNASTPENDTNTGFNGGITHENIHSEDEERPEIDADDIGNIPTPTQWNYLTQEQRDVLSAMETTEEAWNNLDEGSRKQILECC